MSRLVDETRTLPALDAGFRDLLLTLPEVACAHLTGCGVTTPAAPGGRDVDAIDAALAKQAPASTWHLWPGVTCQSWPDLSIPGSRSALRIAAADGGRALGLVLGRSVAGHPDAGFLNLLAQLLRDHDVAGRRIEREQTQQVELCALRDRAALYAGIVDQAMDAVMAVNLDHRIVVFNGAAERMFGVAANHAIGGTLDAFLPPEHRQAHRSHLADYARSGTSTRRMGEARELVGVRANGQRFPIEATISRSGQGDATLMTVTMRDVTLLRQAEKTQLARTAAAAANQARTEFIGRMGHELRTPLNALMGFAQLLRQDGCDRLEENQRQQLAMILQAGDHLAHLVDEMLDIARAESERLVVQPADIDLCDLLRGALAMCEPLARAAGITLHADDLERCRAHLRTDAVRMRQVLLNLISNGIKYNRPGGWVRLAIRHDARQVHIKVRDNGLGMTALQQAQLFQRFNRLGREETGIAGTGIGLALVRRLLDTLGGDLTMDSEVGQGTCVTVSLPLVTETAEPGATACVPHDGSGAGEAQVMQGDGAIPRGVVLYIEDNPINVLLVEQLLARWPDVQVVAATDGASGLERARALHPEVILLDMALPDMSGLDVLRALRMDDRTRGIAAVVLSAESAVADVEAAFAEGALAYWTKPINFDAFIEEMARVLAVDSMPAPDSAIQA